MSKGNILIFCAHPDDEIIGVGGTIAKYVRDGYSVISVIFSFGEGSHWWMEKKFTVDRRINESKMAAKIVGSKETIFLGLKDMSLSEEIFTPKVAKMLRSLIQRYKPVKIFTHSVDDLLYNDHKAVNEIIMKVVEDVKYKKELYTFNVWAVNVRKRDSPKLYVDISHTFKLKLKALKCFESQWLALIQLMVPVFYRAIKSGWKNGCKFAEEFYKLQ